MLIAGPSRRELLRAAPLALAGAMLPASVAWAAVPTLRFLAVGDWGRDGAHFQHHVARHMGRAAAELDAAFVVSTGDNFYKRGVSSATDRQWHSSFEAIYTDASLHRPWYPVLGNHDYGGRVEAQIERTNLSARWRMPARWYDVRLGELGRPDVHLFFLDTTLWKGRESFPYSWLGSSIDEAGRREQHAWLRRTLAASDAPIKLVVGHHPIYTVGNHGGGRRRLGDLDPILREGGVSAYICGHDHCLYHISHEGVHYVCSGGGSEELSRFTGDPEVHGCVFEGCSDPANPLAPYPRWHQFYGRSGFAAFEVGGDRIGFRFIDRDGLMYPKASIPVRGLAS